MSTFISKLLSNHGSINYVGSGMNPNANLSYMRKTFDRADCGAMYTNQAMEMTQALRDTNKPHTPQQNVTIYLRTGFACTWWKAKSNITCARRYYKLQPMSLDIARATILQWSNKEWLGRVLLSWINIRGQRDVVNTHLLTFIKMHWMVVCIKWRILRWATTQSASHWLQSKTEKTKQIHVTEVTEHVLRHRINSLILV